MSAKKLETLANQISLLNPYEKGMLFSLFLSLEKKKKKGSRKSLYGSEKTNKMITDDDIE